MQRMTKFLLAAAIGLLSITAMNAQRIAVVDIQAVLDGMTEYQQAQQELDKTAAQWRQEISKEYDKIRAAYNKYGRSRSRFMVRFRTMRMSADMTSSSIKAGRQGSSFPVRSTIKPMI